MCIGPISWVIKININYFQILTHIGRSEKVFQMKVFITLLFLIFSLQSITKADDISDFEIEGMSIGDSLLNIANETQIIASKSNVNYKSDKFVIYNLEELIDLKIYDYATVAVKKNDKNYIINNIAGIIIYKNLTECLNLKDEIQSEIENIFKSAEADETVFKSKNDPTGKSKIYAIRNYLKPYPSEEAISVHCYDMSKDTNIQKTLKVSVRNNEYGEFIINDAY